MELKSGGTHVKRKISTAGCVHRDRSTESEPRKKNVTLFEISALCNSLCFDPSTLLSLSSHSSIAWFCTLLLSLFVYLIYELRRRDDGRHSPPLLLFPPLTSVSGDRFLGFVLPLARPPLHRLRLSKLVFVYILQMIVFVIIHQFDFLETIEYGFLCGFVFVMVGITC